MGFKPKTPYQQLVTILRQYQFEGYFENYIFAGGAPPYRLSVAFVKEKVGIVVLNKNTNQRHLIFRGKINEAVALGWRVFLVTEKEITPQFVSQLRRALEATNDQV